MQKIILFFIFLCAIMIWCSCQLQQPSAETTPSDLALQWQEDIDQLRALYTAQSLPDYLVQENPELLGSEFDVMQVFDILDHLCMAQGKRLSYYYHYDGMGAYPALYAQTQDAAPYRSESAFQQAHAECFGEDPNRNLCDYLPAIESDGSPLGYLQLVQLRIMGGQFYLNWHANYNDATLIATQTALEEKIDQAVQTTFGQPMSSKQARQAISLDPSPRVEFGKDAVRVRVLWFSNWGGFNESIFEISTSKPHEIQMTETNQLLEYDCGIRF